MRQVVKLMVEILQVIGLTPCGGNCLWLAVCAWWKPGIDKSLGKNWINMGVALGVICQYVFPLLQRVVQVVCAKRKRILLNVEPCEQTTNIK
jgi:hypothetical protein